MTGVQGVVNPSRGNRQKKTIGEVARFFSGGTPQKAKKDFWGAGHPWFSATNMKEKFLSSSDLNITAEGLNNGSRLAPKNSTLILVRGSGLFNYVPICFADVEVAFNQDVKALVANDGIDPVYLHYSIEAQRDFLNGNIGVTGIGAGKFETKLLEDLPFLHLPLSEQEEIGKAAEAFDRKIELNRQMNQTLEAFARAVFLDWFVDFGPTRRKAAGITDPAAILGGLIPDSAKAAPLAALFPDSFGANGLPLGWEERPFVGFIDIIGGGTPKTSNPEYWGGEVPWFSVVDTPAAGNVFVWDTEKTITTRGVAESSARMIPAGTTIISARGTVGNIAMAARAMTFNQSCYGLGAVGPVGNIFVYLATEQMVGRLKAMAHGSVFSTITRATFESLNFAWSGKDAFVAFEEFAAPLFEQIKVNGAENQTLAATRDLLLPKLMSGELRLQEASSI